MRIANKHIICAAVAAILILISVSIQSTIKPRNPGLLIAKQTYIDSENDSGVRATSDKVFAQYEIENGSSHLVHILKLESGCGCAVPRVEPTTIEPGKSGVVYVEANRPPMGEKTVEFTIHADSPTSPELRLKLRTISSRTPPYLSAIHGDLTFNGKIKEGDGADVVVYTAGLDEFGREPEIRVDLPYMQVRRTKTSTHRVAESPIFQHEHTYSISFVKPPPPGFHVGSLDVIDPWDDRHMESLRINVTQSRGLRVFPRILTLNLKIEATCLQTLNSS